MSSDPIINVQSCQDTIVVTITGSKMCNPITIEFRFNTMEPFSISSEQTSEDQTQIITCESVDIDSYSYNAFIKLGKYFRDPSIHKCVFKGYTETKIGANFRATYTQIISINGPVGEQIDILFS